MLSFAIVRACLALLGCGIAAWQDAKTSFIDDKILYGMVAAGVLLDVLTFDVPFITQTAVLLGAVALFGLVCWKAGQFGSGDVLLFLGIAALLPVNPVLFSQFSPPEYLLVLPFILSVFVAASFYATMFTAFDYAAMLFRKRSPSLRSWRLYALAAACAAFAAGVIVFGLGPLQSAALLAFGFCAFFLLLFKQQISDELLIKRVPLLAVEDEDVLALERMPKSLHFGKLATKDVIAKMRKAGAEHVFVYKKLPRFGPFVLAALVTCLLVGDMLLFLVFH
ncbi:Uncharacterised protein [Candidatus Norongarragalina meridionalis]|nr:Uncharacterised protein [Candidatus Norongarragalina meridionalis]